MKRIMISVLIFWMFVFGAETFAQPMMKWKGSGGWGEGSQYGRMYDPKTIETITGTVEKVDKITPGKGMSWRAPYRENRKRDYRCASGTGVVY